MAKENAVLTRQEIYDAVWTLSVSGAAEKYGVKYARLMNACKRSDIPTPPAGYWTKVSMGKDVSGIRKPLPGQGEETVELFSESKRKEAARKAEAGVKSEPVMSGPLPDAEPLPAEKKAPEKKPACIVLRDNGKLHPLLSGHKKEAEKEAKKFDPYMGYASYPAETQTPRDLARQVSVECMPRVYRIMDAVFRSIEKRGGKSESDFVVVINGEKVRLHFKEYKTDRPHQNTKEEEKALADYKRDLERGWRYGKPNIRKYDHVYNGRLSVRIEGSPALRDSDEAKLEDQLDLILDEIINTSHELHALRLEREAKKRAEEEARQREKEIQLRRQEEASQTRKLLNEAEDYRLACQIRSYVMAIEQMEEPAKSAEWIRWAKDKADWLDPTVCREDKYLGFRESNSDIRNSSYDLVLCEERKQNVWRSLYY